MSAVTVIAPGGAEVVGDAPDRRVEILSDDASLNATWSRFAPGRDGADLHVHRHNADHFFVLEGEQPPDGGRPASEADFVAGGPIADAAGLRTVLLADAGEILVIHTTG